MKTVSSSEAMSLGGGAYCTKCKCNVGDSYAAKSLHVLTKHTKEVAQMTGSLYMKVRTVLHMFGIPCL